MSYCYFCNRETTCMWVCQNCVALLNQHSIYNFWGRMGDMRMSPTDPVPAWVAGIRDTIMEMSPEYYIDEGL